MNVPWLDWPFMWSMIFLGWMGHLLGNECSLAGLAIYVINNIVRLNGPSP